MFTVKVCTRTSETTKDTGAEYMHSIIARECDHFRVSKRLNNSPEREHEYELDLYDKDGHRFLTFTIGLKLSLFNEDGSVTHTEYGPAYIENSSGKTTQVVGEHKAPFMV
jgi:hypothetical protein